MKIENTVGLNSFNNSIDYFKNVQKLINEKDISPAYKPLLKVDGVIGQQTKTVIKTVQKFLYTQVTHAQKHFVHQDGIVSPNGITLRYLKTFEFLGISGPGFNTYDSKGLQALKVFGTVNTIAAVKKIALAFNKQEKIILYIGDMSFKNGGLNKDHHGHRIGTNVDIRPIRKDNKNEQVTINDKQYDHDKTKKLVALIKSYYPSVQILFNDKNIPGVAHWKGHDNHMHVIFDL